MFNSKISLNDADPNDSIRACYVSRATSHSSTNCLTFALNSMTICGACSMQKSERCLTLRHTYTYYFFCDGSFGASLKFICYTVATKMSHGSKWGTREFSPFRTTVIFTVRLNGTSHESKADVACFISLTGVNTMARWLGKKRTFRCWGIHNSSCSQGLFP